MSSYFTHLFFFSDSFNPCFCCVGGFELTNYGQPNLGKKKHPMNRKPFSESMDFCGRDELLLMVEIFFVPDIFPSFFGAHIPGGAGFLPTVRVRDRCGAVISSRDVVHFHTTKIVRQKAWSKLLWGFEQDRPLQP